MLFEAGDAERWWVVPVCHTKLSSLRTAIKAASHTIVATEEERKDGSDHIPMVILSAGLCRHFGKMLSLGYMEGRSSWSS
jgi:hypothetical protein